MAKGYKKDGTVDKDYVTDKNTRTQIKKQAAMDEPGQIGGSNAEYMKKRTTRSQTRKRDEKTSARKQRSYDRRIAREETAAVQGSKVFKNLASTSGFDDPVVKKKKAMRAKLAKEQKTKYYS